MSEKIEPALDAGSWNNVQAQSDLSHLDEWHAGGTGEVFTRHEAAALALHGQPFGFTRDHEWALRELASEVRSLLRDPQWRFQDDRSLAAAAVQKAEEAADRIAALLPHDEKGTIDRRERPLSPDRTPT